MSIFNKVTKTFQWGQQTVTLETGEIARQSGGAVVVSIDDTVVLATVVARKDAKPGQDFFPLTVDYIEKTYAAGKIPGSFFKREGRPSELETLTSRLIDRPLRREVRVSRASTTRSRSSSTCCRSTRRSPPTSRR